MKIISISGLDGSGKSTQAKMLLDFLASQNKKTYYFHAVQFSLPQSLKAHKNKLLGKETKAGQEKGVTKANWLQIQLRKFALMVDKMRFKFLIKKLEKQGYDYMITDRFFYDTIVNLTYLMRKNSPLSCANRIPHSDSGFFLKIAPEAIIERQRVPEQGIEYLKAKNELYNSYSALWKLKVLDGNLSPEAINQAIIKETQL